MGEESGKWFKAGPLTVKEWNDLEDFRREVEKYEKRDLTNKDLLLWVVGRGR